MCPSRAVSVHGARALPPSSMQRHVYNSPQAAAEKAPCRATQATPVGAKNHRVAMLHMLFQHWRRHLSSSPDAFEVPRSTSTYVLRRCTVRRTERHCCCRIQGCTAPSCFRLSFKTSAAAAAGSVECSFNQLPVASNSCTQERAHSGISQTRHSIEFRRS
jgi:hypothetical protein